MRILVAPLNWGLGHATRCIPIVRALRAIGHEVVIYADGPGRRLLQSEFPDLEVGELTAYSMRYSISKFWLPFYLLLQLPFFFAAMFRDWLRLPALLRKHGIALVISDGRYGLRTRRVPCVFVTHQLDIAPPGPAWLKPLGWRLLGGLNRWALRGFREVWVPDFPGPRNLAGRLSHPLQIGSHVRYIYPLCRYRREDSDWSHAPTAESGIEPIDILAWASGPEPQRGMFASLLQRQLETLPGTRVLVRGIPSSPSSASPNSEITLQVGKLNVFDHLPGPTLQRMVLAAQAIVCRSGYTSVMELAGLAKRNVLLIPTPGQSEQEYLARHLEGLGAAAAQPQDQLDLIAGWRRSAALPGFGLFYTDSEADAAWNLTEWLRRHPLIL